MEFLPHLPPMLTFFTLLLMVRTTHAASPPELYWRSVLPSSEMPQAITDLLMPGICVSPRYMGGATEHHVWGGAMEHHGKHTTQKLEANLNPFAQNPNVQLYPQYPKHTAINLDDDSNPFAKSQNAFSWAAARKHTDKRLYDNLRDKQGKVTNVKYGNMFFLEKNLHPGMKLELYFTKDPYPSILLPRQVANWIPFSSNKLQDILNMFSIKPGSNEAHFIDETNTMCELPGLSMEDKRCPTSLEAMVDFSTSLFGKNVYAISAEIEKATSQLQNYTVLGIRRVDGGESPVSCHKMRYPYVVHFCHKIPKSKVYLVALKGVDGTKAKGVALCHLETAEWNPANVAFELLKIKPGAPLCHFNPMDTIIWLPRL